MNIQTHVLKTDSDVFEMTSRGQKPYEIRFNDRGYEVGDTLFLKETVHNGSEMKRMPYKYPLKYTGREVQATVMSILRGPIYGLKDGWVILALGGYSNNERE